MDYAKILADIASGDFPENVYLQVDNDYACWCVELPDDYRDLSEEDSMALDDANEVITDALDKKYGKSGGGCDFFELAVAVGLPVEHC